MGSAYVATKHAVRVLTESLREEMPVHVDVDLICPGFVTSERYFGLWRAIEAEAEDPTISLRIGSGVSMEAFDPPIFAAMCSPDLNTALERLARHRRLLAPVAMHVEVRQTETTLELEWLDESLEPPTPLVTAELVFFVQLPRLATRTRIQPLGVTSPRALEAKRAYDEYFGVPVQTGRRPRITYRAEDAALPFLTANEKMWEFFEPQLRARLCELTETATDRRSGSGRLAGAPARRQRLGQGGGEQAGRQHPYAAAAPQGRGPELSNVVNATREELARHYLKASGISGAEISYLLGYEDPNSFFRAFHSWTGETPEQARTAMLAVN